MNIAKMKVSKRLGLGFGLALFLLAALTTLGLTRLSGLNEKVRFISEGRVPNMVPANAWATQLQETASSMEELNSAVKQNADNARQANSWRSPPPTWPSRGGVVVSQVVERP